ncbi:MAG TPA: amino acid permease [Pirellulales bacterium]
MPIGVAGPIWPGYLVTAMLSGMSVPVPSIESQAPEPSRQLDQVLGLFAVIAIVVGEVIGSGIFFKPQVIAAKTGGYTGLILSLWVICGLVNLCGALAMAELASMFPHAGGTYVFLRETYGRLWSFLWAWAEFWVIRTGAIAALAVYMAVALERTLSDLGYDVLVGQQKSVAVSAIAGLGLVTILRTSWSGAIQTAATLIKAGFVAFLAILPFIAMRSQTVELRPLFPSTVNGELALGVGAAVAAIMWAYDGWGNVTVVAEEVHRPERNVPLALMIGVITLIALYTGANLAYHLTLPSDVIAAEVCPAIPVCERLLPNFGAKLMQAMIMVSVFGALSANVLVGPRVLFAVARDHPFLSRFARIHPTTRTPAWAIASMCAWAAALILLGGMSWDPDAQLFDLMSEWTVFGGSIFYFSAGVAVFILRAKRPDAPRPYRTWGYPVVPAVFLVFYVFLLVSMFLERPAHRMIGIALIAAGAIVYLWNARQGEPAVSEQSGSE